MYKDAVYYRSSNGNVPFEGWFSKLSPQDAGDVDRRLDVFRRGGSRANVGKLYIGKKVLPVGELKINRLRVYFKEIDGIIVLLKGGDKNTAAGQRRDVKKAMEYYKDYLDRGDYVEEK